MDKVQQYMEGRRDATRMAINTAHGNRAKLIALKKKRERLAQTYGEDGASHTAHCIRTIDIVMIEEALKATE